MTYAFALHQFSLLCFVLLLVLIALANMLTLQRLGRYPKSADRPKVSVLIPARNEESNIGACAESVLEQDYPSLEVIVLDDMSSDQTAQVVAALAGKDLRLKTLVGAPLPESWLGKHWACHQLSDAATGELLLFIDADTLLKCNAVGAGVDALSAAKADLLCALPHQTMGTWAERLLVPLMYWSIQSFLPLALADRLAIRSLSAAVGQYMLFRRDSYRRIGGHAAVRGDVVDDLALARLIRGNGLRLHLVDGQDHLTCRMYRGWREVRDGFGKTLFAAFRYRTGLFLFVWAFLTVVFTEPLGVLLWARLGGAVPSDSINVAGASVLASVLLWALSFWRFRVPLYLACAYPLIVLLGGYVAVRSLLLTRSGKMVWKGRMLRVGSAWREFAEKEGVE